MKCLSKVLLLGTLVLLLSSIPATSTSTSHAAQTCVKPPDGLVSWWPGDGDATDIADSNDGTLQGNATFAPGLVGQAFSFGGGYDHVRIGNPTNLNSLSSGITLGAWVNPSVAPAPDERQLSNMFAIVTKWGQSNLTDAYGMWLRKPGGDVLPVGSIGIRGISDKAQLNGGVVPVGQWTHVAMTYDIASGINKLYVNGEVVIQLTRPGGITQSNLKVLIGREDSYLPRSFKGRIDEVEIYDRALSADEIQAIVDAGSAGKCKNDGPTITDVSNDGPVNEGASAVITVDATGPADGLHYEFDCDNDFSYEVGPQLDEAAQCAFEDNGEYRVNVRVTDNHGGEATGATSVAVNNVAPSIDSIIAPLDPVNISDQPVGASVTFSDPGAGDTHDVTWNWGDDNSDTQNGGTSPASEDHTYSDAGVYAVQATVTDDDGGSDSTVHEFIVVYDTSRLFVTGDIFVIEGVSYCQLNALYDTDGGFVTGGGWIWSEAGYCQLNDACDGAEGKATFGFVSKYKEPIGITEGRHPDAVHRRVGMRRLWGYSDGHKKGATTPTGRTEIQFKAGNLNFHSSTYDWLVVTGSEYARFKGAGTINGEGEYKFKLWAGDGDPDTFRIKIWWEEGEVEHIVYDNGVDQPIAGGNIVVHVPKK